MQVLDDLWRGKHSGNRRHVVGPGTFFGAVDGSGVHGRRSRASRVFPQGGFWGWTVDSSSW
jgi:hypothetical protein